MKNTLIQYRPQDKMPESRENPKTEFYSGRSGMLIMAVHGYGIVTGHYYSMYETWRLTGFDTNVHTDWVEWWAEVTEPDFGPENCIWSHVARAEHGQQMRDAHRRGQAIEGAAKLMEAKPTTVRG